MNKTDYILAKLLTAVLAIVLWAGGSLAAVILDQSQEFFDGGSPIFNQASLAQTFTPSISDQLDHLDLLVDDHFGDPSYPATISIVETVAGAPTGALLGAVNVPGFVVGWNSIDFLSESVMLNAGSLYGIVLANDDSQWWTPPTDSFLIQWDQDPYPAGLLWEWGPVSGWAPAVLGSSSDPGVADAAFRTYMTPEPASVLLLVMGSALLLLRRNSSTVMLPSK